MKSNLMRALFLSFIVLALPVAFCDIAAAKLPAPSEEQKAQAEDAKAKAAEASKRDADEHAKAQDRVADRYIKEQRAKGVIVKPTPVVVPSAVASAPAVPEVTRAELAGKPGGPPGDEKRKP